MTKGKKTTRGNAKIEKGVVYCDEFWEYQPKSRETIAHPANVFKKNKREWFFLGLTHSDEIKIYGLKTEPLDENPNPNAKKDPEHPSRVTVRPMVAHKNTFSNKKDNWGYKTRADKKITDYFKQQTPLRKKPKPTKKDSG